MVTVEGCEHLVVLTTFGERDKAVEVARALVEEKLAACVNVLGEVRSIYRWQGAVQDDAEVMCVVKTTPERLPALKARLLELHPYEVPEVIALPIVDGSAAYLRWLGDAVRP